MGHGKPETSEWGKLGLGQHYQQVALDVFRALACAGLNTYEWIIMQFVMEQSWYTSLKAKGPNDDYPDPIPCKLGASTLARLVEGPDADEKAVEQTRKLLSRAKASLHAKNLLIESEGGFLPNKNVDSWTNGGGGSLLSPRWRDYAASIQTRRKGVDSATKKGRKPRHQTVAPSATDQWHPPLPFSGGDRHQTVAPSATKRWQAPIEDRGRADSETPADREDNPLPPSEEGREEAAEVQTQTQTVPVPAAYSRSRPTLAEQVDPDGRDGSTPTHLADGSMPGPIVPDDDVIRRTLAFVDRHYGGLDFGLKVTDHKRHFPSHWFLKVFKRLWLRGNRFQWTRVHNILIAWHNDGKPEDGPEDFLGDDMAPLPAAAGPATDAPRTIRLNPAEEKLRSEAAAFRRRAELARQEESANGHR